MVEPTLEDLLDDAIMEPVMRSAGLDAVALKAHLAATATRLAGQPPRPNHERAACCGRELGC